MNRVQKFGLVFVMCLVVSAAVADSLELKNGSFVKGRFMGGDQNSINFQVGSSELVLRLRNEAPERLRE